MTSDEFPEDLTLDLLKGNKRLCAPASTFTMELVGNTSIPEIEATEFEETDLTDDDSFVPLKAIPPAKTPTASDSQGEPARGSDAAATKLRTASASEQRKQKVVEAMAYLAAKGAAKSVANGHTGARASAAAPAAKQQQQQPAGMTTLRLVVATGVALAATLALIVTFLGSEETTTTMLPRSLSDLLVTRILGLKTLHITRAVLVYVLAYVCVEFGEAYMPEDFMMLDNSTSTSKQHTTRMRSRRRVPLARKDM